MPITISQPIFTAAVPAALTCPIFGFVLLNLHRPLLIKAFTLLMPAFMVLPSSEFWCSIVFLLVYSLFSSRKIYDIRDFVVLVCKSTSSTQMVLRI